MINSKWLKELGIAVIVSLITTTLTLVILYFSGYISFDKPVANIKENNIIKKSDIIVTVVYDKRCLECNTSGAITDLKGTPFLKDATFELKEFSTEGVPEYLKTKGITKLPVILFNKTNIDKEFDKYLTKINENTYSLNVGSNFDPFVKRSDKGFLILDLEKIKEITKNSYIKGKKTSKITWLEYSDMECPYCAKLHNSDTSKLIFDKFGDKINFIYNHFPLDIHSNAQKAGEILECSADQKGGDVFYNIIRDTYLKYTESLSIDGMKEIAFNNGVNKSKLEKCLNGNVNAIKVKEQMNRGIDLFYINGTPGNILINNETGEYQILNGNYPSDFFIKVIDKLLE